MSGALRLFTNLDFGFYLDGLAEAGAGVDQRLEYTLAAGTYYILVSGSPADDVNSYTLTLTAPLAGDDFEPDNRTAGAKALPLGTTVSSFIFTRNDEDWYRIVTTAEGHLVVTLNVPDSVGYELTLLNSFASYVASDPEDGDGVDEEAVATVPAGTYYAVVRGYRDEFFNEDELPGEYSQTARYSLTALSGTFTDTFEPNNTREAARPVGPGTLVSKAYGSEDQDWYRFNVSATGAVSIVLEVPPEADLEVDLRDSSGTVIARANDVGLRSRRIDCADAHRPWCVPTSACTRQARIQSPAEYTLTVTGDTIMTPRTVHGDFDGDGATDLAVYRAATGTWRVRNQPDVQFGQPGDLPVPGDYNDDGRADIAVYRPSSGAWFVRNQFAVQFGEPGDVPVPGDYNGDGTDGRRGLPAVDRLLVRPESVRHPAR